MVDATLKQNLEIKQSEIQENCWSTIGVWGIKDEKCPQLNKVVHCRNCDVYTNAGRGLLAREATAEYINEWTQQLASEPEKETSTTLSVVVFRIGDEWLALPTTYIQEIVEMRPIHTVPHTDKKVIRGIVFVRGELRIAVSIGGLLGIQKGKKGNDDHSQIKFAARMIIFDHQDNSFVFPVTKILGTHNIDQDEIQNLPSTLSNSVYCFLNGVADVDEKRIGLIDGGQLSDGILKALR
ncbi:MAG: chemotaxis protein CheW [Gammaproteobacteria bacterium]